jgi:pimeloyl-ACP methyl ester carboxylesterase
MMKKIIFKGKALHYQVSGQGNTLVLLHGFLESLSIWDDFAGQLSSQFRVIRIDLPGHGKTPVLDQIHTMELMAAAVKAILDGNDVERCAMIGHSMGGYVTLEFARHYPEMLSGIGLFHSHAGADTQEARENRLRTIEVVKLNRTGFIKQFIPDLFAENSLEKHHAGIEKIWEIASSMSAQGIIAALHGMKDRSGKLDLLLNTNIPVLFIAGKEDPRIPVQNILAQAILPKHCEVLVLGEVGHMGFIEAKQKTLQMVSGFATKVMG